MARPVTVLPPAPSLPAPSETPARLPAGEAFRRETVSRVAPRPSGRAAALSGATAVHDGFLKACGGAQADYLALMAEAARRFGGARGSSPLDRRSPGSDARDPGEDGPTTDGSGPGGALADACRPGRSRPAASGLPTSPSETSRAGSHEPRQPLAPAVGFPPVSAGAGMSAAGRGAPSAGARPATAEPDEASAASLGDTASQAAADDRAAGDGALSAWLEVRGDDLLADLTRAPWLGDHRPDHGVAVLPMTGALEIVAASARAAVPGRVVRVSDLSLRSWIVLGHEPLRLRRRVETRPDGSVAVTLLAWREAARAALSRDEPVAGGVVEFAAAHPPPPPDPEPLAAPEPVPDPYASAELFHGPAFQLLRGLRADGGGVSAELDLGASSAPVGLLHPVALDAALQLGAVKRWSEWCGAEVGGGKCLPVRLRELTLHGPTPRGGPGRVEMRGRGVDGHPRFPVLEFSLYAGARMWARMTVVFVAVPEGPLDAFPALARRAHLRDRAFVPGVRVSRERAGVTTLRDEDLAAAEWIPRTIRLAYGIEGATDVALAVATREHAAARLGVHPSAVSVEGGVARGPSGSLALSAAREGPEVTVRDAR